MYGPDFKTILNEYAEITGRMELYGKWAHGFMLSKYGNENATQAEFLEWIHRLRDEDYPADCYVFDYGWRGDVADNGGNQTGAGQNGENKCGTMIRQSSQISMQCLKKPMHLALK